MKGFAPPQGRWAALVCYQIPLRTPHKNCEIDLLKLSVNPSFEDAFVLTLVKSERREEMTYLLRYEERKITTPLVAGCGSVGQDFSLSEEIRVSNETVEQILQIAQKASTSVMPAYALGLDGTMFELCISNGLNEVRFKWWATIPKEWEPLKEISDALLKLAGKVIS